MNTQESHNQISTTNWFRIAAPYIHAHRGATFVIAFDGDTIASKNFSNLIHDFALLNSLGMRIALVFGARKQIDTQCKVHHVESNYHNDIRITDEKSLKIVRSVLGKLRIDIEAALSFNMPHTPMADAHINCISGNWVTAKPFGIRDGIDFFNTGQVRRVDSEAIHQQLGLGNIVLISPLGYSPTGEVFNLPYESVAEQVAISLNADKLIFVGNATDELAREMTLEQAKQVASTSHPIQAAIKACEGGVERVHLLDRATDGVLLQELFSRDGAGTLITATSFESTRQATIDDVNGILELIQPLENKGTLVKRSREHLEMEIDHFTVMERDGSIIACAALYPYAEVAELACLAVRKSYQDTGRGKHLLETIEKHAKQQSLNSLCVLTTQTAHWFLEHGFNEAAINDLPVEKQQFYNYQRNAKVFIKDLS
jgi:amino-acid N-acetyltransferase